MTYFLDPATTTTAVEKQMSFHDDDINEIMAFCSVSEPQAKHYLNIFKSKDRAVTAHVDHANDPTWFAHLDDLGTHGGTQPTTQSNSTGEANPKTDHTNPKTDDADDWACNSCGQNNDRGYRNCGNCNTAKSSEPSAPPRPSPFSSNTSKQEPKQQDRRPILTSTKQETKQEIKHDDGSVDPMDDRTFYASYQHMVDTFCNQVVRGCDLATLRTTVHDADSYLNQSTHSYGTGGTQSYGIGSSSAIRIPVRSNLPNRICYMDDADEGRTPLSYATAMCDEAAVRNLIKLGADPCKVMPSQDGTRHTTALVLAVTNEHRDGTEMVRLLLSLGAMPQEVDKVLTTKELKRKYINRTMKYWLKTARHVIRPDPKVMEQFRCLPPMDKLHEIHYAVVGQKPALMAIEEKLSARFANPAGNKKSLVLLLLGPPGHGKTYLSRNMAKSLVGEDNYLEIAMGSIRDDADLFGGNNGGHGGSRASDGQLTSWLRARQGRNNIVFLDEFEKVKELTSSLGWDQSKKIYQSFLEPWQEGVLTDQGKNAHSGGGYGSTSRSGTSNKIDCSKTVWILTSNWGQDEIVQFAADNADRVYRKMDEQDEAWLHKHLVKKQLKPIVLGQFSGVHKELKALASRIDRIIPFLPFTTREQKVVADTALRERENLYRSPAVTTGDTGQRRAVGNMHLCHTKQFGDHAANEYDPMEGARSMVAMAGQVDGKFNVAFGRGSLNITTAQRDRMLSTVQVDDVPEPKIWIHYDSDSEVISLQTKEPSVDDRENDKDSDSEEEEEEEEQAKKDSGEFQTDLDDSGHDSWRSSGSFTHQGSGNSTRQNPFKK